MEDKRIKGSRLALNFASKLVVSSERPDGTNILKFLLAQYPTIDTWFLNQLLHTATQRDNEEIIGCLLKALTQMSQPVESKREKKVETESNKTSPDTLLRAPQCTSSYFYESPTRFDSVNPYPYFEPLPDYLAYYEPPSKDC